MPDEFLPYHWINVEWTQHRITHSVDGFHIQDPDMETNFGTWRDLLEKFPEMYLFVLPDGSVVGLSRECEMTVRRTYAEN